MNAVAPVIPDWRVWQPQETCVLCFIRQDDRLLLIRKKRGLGAGKINGPGGRREPGETAVQAAVRETREELGVVPRDLRLAGELYFQFMDGYAMHCTVFAADGCEGVPVETDEAIPLWFDAGQMPFEEMWADDRHWFPHFFAGRYFTGYFVFEGDGMLAQEIVTDGSPTRWVGVESA